ncbi:MAG TPA: M28 family peptidase, partial [Kofleriaceae bacterium]
THPTVPIGNVAVDINYDGGNIWGKTRDVTYVGRGKTDVDPLLDALAGRQGRKVKPDQFPDRGSFYRSDQFSFAKVGVPGIYLGSGTDFIGHDAGWGRDRHEEYERKSYHQPSDQLQPDWNFDGMVENAQLGFEIGVQIANADHGPAWQPGDEFEAARKASQAGP